MCTTFYINKYLTVNIVTISKLYLIQNNLSVPQANIIYYI